MKFGPAQVMQSEGKILGHNISCPERKRVLRKGIRLTLNNIILLQEIGRYFIYVAESGPGDIEEDLAAERIARVACGEGIRFSRPVAGRMNLLAQKSDVLRIKTSNLERINEFEGITLATLPSHPIVQPRDIVATNKVIPFAVPGADVCAIEAFTNHSNPIVQLFPLRVCKVSLILSSSLFVKERVIRDFTQPKKERLENLGSVLHSVDFVPLEEKSDEINLADTIKARAAEGAEIIILSVETAVMDRYDIAPRSGELTRGKVVCFGAPVDPGNLLMLAYLEQVPILGAPGCARSKKFNVLGWVLPPLLAGDILSRQDIIHLGHGGLIDNRRN